ncbi:hypothetical protein NKH77_35825 [Streptomyces sp. M19]
MTPAQLSSTVLHTVRRAVAADELYVAAPELPQRVVMRRPPRPGCGDYATNVALQLAGPAGRDARDVAAVLRRRLVREPGIARVDVAGPGFLNITLEQRSGPTSSRPSSPSGRPRARSRTARSGRRPSAGRPPPGQDVPDVRALLYARTSPGWYAPAVVTYGTPRTPPAPARTLLRRRAGRAPGARRRALGAAAHAPRRAPARPRPAARPARATLFRVRYAHARTRALLRGGHALGITPKRSPQNDHP